MHVPRARPEERPEDVHVGPVREAFSRFSQKASHLAGGPWSFVVALGVVLTWALSGPILGFSNTWQLMINTTTTIVTFLMVFLIQNSQNKDTEVLHLKLDELLAANERASNRLIGLEELGDADVERLRLEYRHLAAELAERDRASASVDDARAERHERAGRRGSTKG